MNGRETAIEATLLFTRPPKPDLPALARHIEGLCRRIVPGIGIRPAAPDHLTLAGSGASVVISYSGPLDTDQFLPARRPDDAALRATDATLRLIGHRAALAIRATGVEREQALCLCYAGTATMVSATDPDLIHWSASDTLYALPEFLAKAGATDIPVANRPIGASGIRPTLRAFRRPVPLAAVPPAKPSPPPHRANRVQRPIVKRQRRDGADLSNNTRYAALLFPQFEAITTN